MTILDPEFQKELQFLYHTYNQTIKPLIASIEARYEIFPLPVINEIRAFNDHVAQCYREDTTSNLIKDELDKASGHLKRLVFDCFKYLNVSLHDSIVRFENQTKRIDLTTIDNGEFILKYRQLRQDSTKAVRKGKEIESFNKQVAFEEYEKAFDCYMQLEELIEINASKISWAKARFTLQMGIKILGWLIAAILSGIISAIIACNFL